MKLRGLIEFHAEELVQTLIKKAKEGDLTALKLCIERLVPKARNDETILFKLPEGRIDMGANMLAITNLLTDSVMNGEMSIHDAEKLRIFLRQQKFMLEEAERQLRNDEWQAKWNKS